MEVTIKEQPTKVGALKSTPLESLHKSFNARMIPFADYLMPLQYEGGIISEHNHTRNHASLFDISHMGQIYLSGTGVSDALEALVPGNIKGMSLGSMRYTILTNDKGGILDDIIVTRLNEGFLVVLNASCFDADMTYLKSHINSDVKIDILSGHALLALQGPEAAVKLSGLAHNVIDMPFMSARKIDIGGTEVLVSRSGYTGEDGFEISVPLEAPGAFAKKLLNIDRVELAGLGARDTLRLEAGLCLYGQEINAATTPIEAGLGWTISKRRREEGIFPGADIIKKQFIEGITRKLVGIRPSGRRPARTGTLIRSLDGKRVGSITSGSFGPTVGGPIAMGYVAISYAEVGVSVSLDISGKPVPATVTSLPFIQHRYFKHSKSAPGDK